jgi:electron transport complex protein RnfB
MEETNYWKLAEHLDQLPGGFISSDSEADLRLLERFFTADEAELATHLPLDREKAQVII